MAENGVILSQDAARVILRVLDEITDLDCRAKCSDKFFRAHFITLVTVPPVREAYAELRKAVDAH